MEQSVQHSIRPPFDECGDSNFAKYWSMQRDCHATDGHISLTKAIDSYQAGALWNKEPCQYKSWKVKINYKMHSPSDIMAYGMAFWYVPPNFAFSTSEIYGGRNDFTGLLVAMDNFQNPQETRNYKRARDESLILAVYHDRERSFNFLKANQGDNDKEIVRRNRITQPHERTVLIINYDYDRRALTVTSRDLDGEAICFILRDLDIPTGYHFGLTARTGEYNCNQEIVSMKTYVKDPVVVAVMDPVKDPMPKVAVVFPFSNQNKRFKRTFDYFS